MSAGVDHATRPCLVLAAVAAAALLTACQPEAETAATLQTIPPSLPE